MSERRMWFSGCLLGLAILVLTLIAFSNTSAIGL